MLRPFLLAFALALAGCATTPPTPLAPLTPMAQDGRGRIVVRPFYMPSGANVIAGFMAGGTTPFKVTLYDVTAEPRYLGEMFSPGVLSQSRYVERRGYHAIQTAFEVDVEPGTRVLMLHMKFGRDDFIDFVEVPVAANQIEHVAISQYGMLDRPYLVKNDFDQRATWHCNATQRLKNEQIVDYLKAQGIAQTKHAARYCEDLSWATQVRPAEPATAWTAKLPREQVTGLRDKWLPVWRSMANRTPPYDVVPPAPPPRT